MEKTMSETREVKDLAIGDIIQVDGFDDNMTVRSAKKIRKGLDAGKLEVALAAPDGEREVMAFAPDERVKVVAKDPDAGKGKSDGKAKGKGKGKAKAKAKAEPEAETATPTPESQASAAPAPRAKAETSKRRGSQKKAGGEKKMSALDAAAKVLSETGQAMNCQELIQAMAQKGYWTSPGGKTPSATLYSAILRETQTKGKDTRFKKTERGKFTSGHSR
jgi:hypothetical protein